MDSRLAGFGLSLLVLYFAYHAFAGESGLGRWSDMQVEISKKETILSELEKEISHLKRDISRLTPGSIDPDFMEELAREKLAFVYPGELILID